MTRFRDVGGGRHDENPPLGPSLSHSSRQYENTPFVSEYEVVIGLETISFNAPTRPSFVSCEFTKLPLLNACLLPADMDQRHVCVSDVQVGLLARSVYWALLELRPSLLDVLSTT